jgi:hypothetical protein
MSTAAQFPVSATDVTLAMRVANMTFMLERLAQDCGPLQFVRELTQNAIDSITALNGQHGDIVWDVDWTRYDLEPKEGFKLAVIDNGIGMTGPDMVNYINQLSSSMHEQSKHGNFGMGAKIAAAPRNQLGLVYVSWKDGHGSMIHLWKDPDTDTYGLRRHQNGEFWLPISNDIRPDAIKDHGTMVILLGNKLGESTIESPPEGQIPSRWILRYLNTRYFRFPQGVTVKARENWTLPKKHKHNMLRKVVGQEAFLKANSQDSGSMALKQATAHWWILKEKVDDSGAHFASGHVASLFNNELYEMALQRTGVARLQSFGVIFGYGRVVIYVEPLQDNAGSLTANTARTQLLIDGQPLPWSDWAAEFRENMPEAITRLMDQVAAGASNSENAISIRERLKQIRELFKFSRYRPASDGKHLIDEDDANAGGKSDSKRNGGGGSRGSNGKGRSSGRAGDIYSLFAETGTTPADEIGGFADPKVTWVSIASGSRTKDILEDRAAQYVPYKNEILANADFRVFTDMIERWKRFYSLPSAAPVVESSVKEWFEQQLIEAVLGAIALRKSGNWSEQEVEKLWTEEALTSAVLPRYHVDQNIKRALGQKLGSLKDKESA